MSSDMHIIQREIFEFSVPRVADARKWETRMYGVQRDVIENCLESVFDRLYQDKDAILDRLVIDLGLISPETTNDEIRKRVLSSLYQQDFRNEFISHEGRQKDHDVLISCTRHEHDWLASLMFYLEQGVLAWWIQNVEQLHPLKLSPSQYERLSVTLKHSVAARIRLARLYDTQQLIVLFSGIESEMPIESISAFWDWLQSGLSQAQLDRRDLTEVLFNYLWLDSLTNADGLSPDLSGMIGAMIHEICAALKNKGNHSMLNELWEITGIEKIFLQFKCHQQYLTLLRQSEEMHGAEPTGDRPHTENTAEDHTAFVKTAGAIRINAGISPKTEKLLRGALQIQGDFDLPANKKTLTDTIYTEWAGIVLLHPFLKELFMESGFWTSGSWVLPHGQFEALKALVFCTHGTTEVPEAWISLEKLLCGMSLDTPYLGGVMQEDCIQGCNDLLNAVINHWQALGQVSRDALREGFFKREGKLSMKANDWQLDVERKAQDILLSKLPWGLSHIHLPWMPGKYLAVQWA
jgi:hypothetical protein